jgi:cytochrome b
MSTPPLSPAPEPDPAPVARRVLVWDLPVRIFHVLLAVSFLLAWALAVTSDDESRAFAVHALLGLFIAALVAFRLGWGLIGTRHARFAGFAARPSDLVGYLKGLVGGPEREYVGHNPASSYATMAMLVLLVAMIGTGVLLGRGNEAVEDLHPILAHAMLALVGLHVIGVIVHTVRHRDPIALGMIHGHKPGPPSAAIRSARPVSALVLSVLLASWAAALWRGYDPAAGRLTLLVLGATLSLGDHEAGTEDRGAAGPEHEEEADDD